MGTLGRPIHFSIPGVKAYLAVPAAFNPPNDYMIQRTLNDIYVKYLASPDMMFVSPDTKRKLEILMRDDPMFRYMSRYPGEQPWPHLYPNKVFGGWLKVVEMPDVEDNTILFASAVPIDIRRI